MIQDADRYVTEFVACGARSVSVHVEACAPTEHDQIRSAGALAGALNPATPLEWIEPVLEHMDYMLLTVNPGFGGQSFIPSVLPKIKGSEWIRARPFHRHSSGWRVGQAISVVHRAGATNFVAGSAF